jgi:hypothetical protein
MFHLVRGGIDVPARGVITPRRPIENTTPEFCHPLKPSTKVSHTKKLGFRGARMTKTAIVTGRKTTCMIPAATSMPPRTRRAKILMMMGMIATAHISSVPRHLTSSYVGSASTTMPWIWVPIKYGAMQTRADQEKTVIQPDLFSMRL